MIGVYNYPYVDVPNFEFKYVTSLDIGNIDKLLVYWEKSSEGEKSSFEQLALINLCLKKHIPVIIIDLNREMTYTEAKTCIDSNIALFEPYMITRKFFSYLPEPVSLDFPKIETDDRTINICYHTTLDTKNSTSFDINIIDDFKLSKIYLALDPVNYKRYGRISPQTFKAASAGCIPLIPHDHRLMHGLITCVGKPIIDSDIQYYINRAEQISYGYCYRFIENVRNMYPEFGIEYFKEVILNANDSSQI